jgi:hypothetical protein
MHSSSLHPAGRENSEIFLQEPARASVADRQHLKAAVHRSCLQGADAAGLDEVCSNQIGDQDCRSRNNSEQKPASIAPGTVTA